MPPLPSPSLPPLPPPPSPSSSLSSSDGHDPGDGLFASVARTAARSGQSLFRRLPEAKIPLSKVTRGRLPTRQLAKVADQGSTLVDVVEAHEGPSLREAVKRNGAFRALSSAGARTALTFGKNAALGAALFESYEYLVDSLPPSQSSSVHFLCGAAAGASHASLATALDTASSSLSSRHLTLSPSYPLHRLLHHTLTHSSLFGTFEATKRPLTSALAGAAGGDPGAAGHVSFSHGAAVALSGGLAGGFSHVVSHYSETWENTGTFRTTGVERVTARAAARAMPPAALGFVAFEYAKDVYGGGGGSGED